MHRRSPRVELKVVAFAKAKEPLAALEEVTLTGKMATPREPTLGSESSIAVGCRTRGESNKSHDTFQAVDQHFSLLAAK